jgi:hypothetical protein
MAHSALLYELLWGWNGADTRSSPTGPSDARLAALCHVRALCAFAALREILSAHRWSLVSRQDARPPSAALRDLGSVARCSL